MAIPPHSPLITWISRILFPFLQRLLNGMLDGFLWSVGYWIHQSRVNRPEPEEEKDCDCERDCKTEE